MNYYYTIILDEPRDFYAEVRDQHNQLIFPIFGFDIFEDGHMINKHDMAGLHEYMVELEIIFDDSSLFCTNEH